MLGERRVMKKLDPSPLLGRMSRGLLINIVAFCLLLTTTMTAWASVEKIVDQANVLNENQVRSAGASLRYPVEIYTIPDFSGTSSQFKQRARDHLTSTDLIVIAISTSQHRVTIVAGSRVPLSSAESNNAVSSFRQGYQNSGSNFTSATVSALQSLQSAVGTSSAGSNSRDTSSAPASGGGMLNGVWCLVGLVILAALAFFVIRRRRSGDLPLNQQPQYNQPYQGNYPPNYGPGYPPQQGGINPLAAGGLGAVAGGLLGYELGKHQGEQGAREDQGSSGDPGQYGGGSVGDFGGGSDEGDFGGGSVGDFGGGSDGGDFGGGSSGDF
jgi:ABC-type cobalt transport system substrate-binding protein